MHLSSIECNIAFNQSCSYLAILFCHNYYYSTPCLDNIGNYITVYAGYNEEGDSKNFCNSVRYRYLCITGLYAYIKFHSNAEDNFDNIKGFSKVEFTAKGMCTHYNNVSLYLFQISMSVI